MKGLGIIIHDLHFKAAFQLCVGNFSLVLLGSSVAEPQPQQHRPCGSIPGVPGAPHGRSCSWDAASQIAPSPSIPWALGSSYPTPPSPALARQCVLPFLALSPLLLPCTVFVADLREMSFSLGVSAAFPSANYHSSASSRAS